VTVRERALELLHEVSGLLEQLLGEVDEADGDTKEPETNVDPEPASEPVSAFDCPQGGDHKPFTHLGSSYCRKCNKLLALEE